MTTHNKPVRIILCMILTLALSISALHSFAQESHWKLVAIKSSGLPIAPATRQWKDLSIDTREQTNIHWQSVGADKNEININAQVYFKRVQEIIKVNDVLILGGFDIVGSGFSTYTDAVIFQFYGGWETASGKEKISVNSGAFKEKIRRGVTEKFNWGFTLLGPPDIHEDFTLYFKLLMNFGGRGAGPEFERDVTYYFHYKWMGASEGEVSDCFAHDPGAGLTNRETHFDWAEKQPGYMLLNELKWKLEKIFDCKSMDDQKLVKLFGNLSVIVARNATKECFPDDEGTRTADYSVQTKWASEQTRKELNKNLLYKIPQTFDCLNRSQQNSFFADLSVAMAVGTK